MASLVMLALLPFVFVGVQGFDADPLQDFCVADLNSTVHVNGFVCKDPGTVDSDDFFFDGLVKPGNTSNLFGSSVTTAFVTNFPGLYTLGISMARLDFAPGGLNPPHTHPRASEILIVIEGTLLAGFVTSNPRNIYFSKKLEKGEVFLFPRGTTHFQQNLGSNPALAIVALSSSGPGRADSNEVTFGAFPRIPGFILARTFQINECLVDLLQSMTLARKQEGGK